MYIINITFKSTKKINSSNLQKKIFTLKNLNTIRNIKKKNKTKIFTLLRSPHVNKKSREHFIYRNFVHKFEIKFLDVLELFNFLILLKKSFTKNFLINIKIKKCL